jgi:hypothetical protein
MAEGFSVLNGTDLVSLRGNRRAHDAFAGYLRALEAVVNGTASKGAVQAVPSTYPVNEDNAINRRLQQKTSLRYQAVPLDQILAEIARKHGIEIVIDQKAFGDEGLNAREPLTCQLNDITLHAGLRELLRGRNMNFYVANGELMVTSENGERSHDLVTFYDVLDLLHGDVDEGMNRISDLVAEGTPGYWFANGGEIETPFSGILLVNGWPGLHEEIVSLLAELRCEHSKNLAGPQPQKNSQQFETRFYNLADYGSIEDVLTAIPQFVVADSWKPETGAAIQKVGQTLAIRQTRDVHKQIDQFLLAWKSKQAKSKPAATPPKSP